MKTLQKCTAILMALLLLCGLWVFPASAEEPTPVRKLAIVQAGSLNVRELPDENSTRVGGLSAGKEVYVLDQTVADGKVWYRIQYTDRYAYIQGAYVQLVKEIGMANIATVNVLMSSKTGNVFLAWGSLSYGEGVYILAKTVENDGSEWYQVYFDGHIGYVLTQQLNVMAFPTSALEARYKKDIRLSVSAYNVPKDYALGVDEQRFFSTGQNKLVVDVQIGQLTQDYPVSLVLYNTEGYPVAGTEIVVPVNNGFFAKVLSVFGFIFSGFRWGRQTVLVA